MHQFPVIVGSYCTWHWQDLDWNQQVQGTSWREAGKFWNQLELNSFLVNYNSYEACINIFFLCFRNMLILGMTLTTSRKELTSRMRSLKSHKRGRRLNF
jgi:hypothetical protein